MACPECNGSKTVERSVGNPNDWDVYTTTCPVCEGEGTVPALECRECGCQIDDSNLDTARREGDDLYCHDCYERGRLEWLCEGLEEVG